MQNVISKGFNGNLIGGQLAFPAIQIPSAGANVLDDYEEGIWTPVLTFATPGDLNVGYTEQVGVYQKIGNWVKVSFTLRTNAFTHTTASSTLRVTGLPFVCVNLANSCYCGAGGWRGITKANFTDIAGAVQSTLNYIQFYVSGSGQIYTNIVAGDMPTGGTVILRFTLAYRATA